MPDIAEIPANLTTAFLESFLYGVLSVLFISTVYFLANRRTLAGDRQSAKHHFLSLPFLGVAVLFLIVTVHWSMVLYQAYFAFIHLRTFALQDAFYADLADPSEMVKSGFTPLLSFLVILLLCVFEPASPTGGLLMSTRGLSPLDYLGAQPGGRLVPGMRNRGERRCICDGAVLAIGLLYVETKWEPSLRGAPFNRMKNPWAIPGYVLSFSTNIYSTGFIVYRIHKVSKTAKSASGHTLMSFLSILAESAALQTIWLICTALLMFLRTDTQFIFVDCLPAILGISNMLIHARVGLGWSQYSGVDSTAKSRSTTIQAGSKETV